MRRGDKPIRLRDLADTDQHQVLKWRQCIRDETFLIKHVRTIQRTLRLTGLIPSWDAFWHHPYAHLFRKALDGREIRKYKAWWDLLFLIDDSGRDKNAARLAYLYCTAESIKRGYGKIMIVHPDKLGYRDEARIAQIREETLKRFEDLTLT